jgi:hypothetical protein
MAKVAVMPLTVSCGLKHADCDVSADHQSVFLLVCALQYTLGDQPGDYVVITALSKDQLVWNVTYTTRPVVAARLPLPFNATLHHQVRSGAADPQIGAVRDVQDLVVTVSLVFFLKGGG